MARRKLQSILLTWDDGNLWEVDGPSADDWWQGLSQPSAKFLVLAGHPRQRTQDATESLAATPEEAFEGKRS